MEYFYKLINKLILLNYEIKETSSIFEIEFKYTSDLDFLIQYNYLRNISDIFCDESLKLYISINNDINIFDFLDNEDEFKEEIAYIREGTNFKLILKKNNFIKYKFGDFNNSRITFFILEDNLLNFLDQDINLLEDKVFKQYKKNIFILANSNVFIKNDYFMITNLNSINIKNELDDFNNIEISESKDVISSRNEVCNWIDGSHFLIPDYFYIDLKNENFRMNDKIQSILYKKNINLVMAFISNFTGIVDGKYKSIINGNKRIEVEYDIDLEDYKFSYYNNMFQLYQWIYENSTFDKINICRNVISILVTAKCQGTVYKTILVNSDWLLKSVKDNFKLFLQNNIDSYFEQKNSIIKEIRNEILENNNQTNELTKLSNSSIISSIGLIVAGIITYSTKINILMIRILCLIYLFYLDINSMFNLPLIITRFIQSKNNFKRKKIIYINNYNTDEEIESLIRNNTVSGGMFIIYILLTIFLIMFLNFIVIGVIYNKPYINIILKLFGI